MWSLEGVIKDESDGTKQKKQSKNFQNSAYNMFGTVKVLNVKNGKNWFQAKCHNISNDEYQKMGNLVWY